MNPIVVREYARLTTDEVTSNLDQDSIRLAVQFKLELSQSWCITAPN